MVDLKKKDDLLRKNRNIRGKRWKNGGKEEIFSVLGGKIGGGGKNRNNLDNMHPELYVGPSAHQPQLPEAREG